MAKKRVNMRRSLTLERNIYRRNTLSHRNTGWIYQLQFEEMERFVAELRDQEERIWSARPSDAMLPFGMLQYRVSPLPYQRLSSALELHLETNPVIPKSESKNRTLTLIPIENPRY